MHQIEIKPKLNRILQKLKHRDRTSYNHVLKKIREIQNSYGLDHYKNLRYDLNNQQRVHLGHFVLTFTYEEKKERIVFLDYDHHDKIYEK